MTLVSLDPIFTRNAYSIKRSDMYKAVNRPAQLSRQKRNSHLRCCELMRDKVSSIRKHDAYLASLYRDMELVSVSCNFIVERPIIRFVKCYEVLRKRAL